MSNVPALVDPGPGTTAGESYSSSTSSAGETNEQRPSIRRFVVRGVPVPQAGTQPVPTAQGWRQVTRGGKGLSGWRAAVSAEARRVVLTEGPLIGPVALTVEFRLPMPRSRPASIRRIGRSHASTKPDLDKLIRSVGDSLEVAGLIETDSRIVEIRARKIETTGEPGAWVEVRSVAPLEPIDV